ncbi:hypothetical protein F9U64_14940 [Gracilibacillus oryzae]|uniref:Multidrug resistance protein MdtA-like C-terminal permuted SH3 domain-containing protein n=1 Tax=Gracilibacillus oryzae TaxID=1672701 RepID=A0A7C8KP35_9BACI|nr:hypothetical protein [Gracilibacillus oryzae]KAB8129700.1 hypothetical protein F9U64_14940 [Gracilibacillus oryzae]
MKRYNKVLWCVNGILLLFLFGCSIFPKEEAALAPPLVKPASEEIATVEASTGTLVRSLSGTGVFESTEMAYHQFTQTSGRAEEVFFYAGDTVKKGDVLLRLENRGEDLEVLKKQLELEKKQLALDEAKFSGNDRKIRIAQLERDIAQKEYDAVKHELTDKQLKAKMDGVIVFDGGVKAGDTIESYQMVYTVANPAETRLAFSSTSDAYLKDVTVGMTADITFRNKSYKGKVVQTPSTAPSVEDEELKEKYKNQLYIELEEAPDDIQIGEKATVQIVLDKKENVVIVPKNTVHQILNEQYVHVLEEGIRREKVVEAGISNATDIEIIRGLEAGEQVIVK